MTELHEILAVESSLKGEAVRACDEISKTLHNVGLFIGQIKTYAPNDEDGETQPTDTKIVQHTAKEMLAWLEDSYSPWIDVAIQKEIANTNAKANVEIDGVVILEDMPATALLNLENKLADIERVIKGMPVYDPAESWERDTDQGVWKTKPRHTNRTTKRQVPLELSPATEKHPAQVALINEDKFVGVWETTLFCGALSPTAKRKILANILELAQAVKRARQRANTEKIEERKVAADVFAHILSGVDLL